MGCYKKFSLENYTSFFLLAHLGPETLHFMIFTVRRYALHGLCDRNSVRPSVCLSVCLSVCHTRALCPHGSTYDHDFFTVW